MSTYRFTIGGQLCGAQRWSTGFSAVVQDGGTTPTGADMTALCNSVFARFNTSAWFASGGGASALGAFASTDATMDSVRGYFYPTNAQKALVVGASTSATLGGSGTPALPPQVSIVASLITGYAGRSNRGRMYLPFRTGATLTLGNINTTAATGIATSIANFLSAVRTISAPGGFLTPIVDSSTGTDYPITAVSVDTVLDTQRRRRDKVVGQRSTVNLVVG